MRSRCFEREGLADLARELRHQPTLAEDRLWQAVRRKALGAKFRRQVPYGRYILDFLAIDCSLAIEVDGSQHRDNLYDQERDSWLRARGLTVLRFWNNEITDELPAVLAAIHQAIQAKRMPPPPDPLPLRGVGEQRAGDDIFHIN